MRKSVLTFIILVLCLELNSQTIQDYLTGQVSFISSQNIYVKFKSTAGLATGDTLFITSGGRLKPALIVKDLSSSSCSCIYLPGIILSVSDQLLAKNIRTGEKITEEPQKIRQEEGITEQISGDTVITEPANGLKQKIRGSISLNSYSDFSDSQSTDLHRFRYTLSFNRQNIANSKFSVDSYISFRHRAGHWDEVRNDVFTALKIYNLSLKYDINKTTRASFGRWINPLVSSIGPVDGLQFEKSFNRFTMGALLGTRPDYRNFGFNSALLQYGAFVSYTTGKDWKASVSSLAFMQQMNHSRTDRRFLYLQHSNSPIRDLNFLGNMEVDLYQLNTDSVGNENPQNKFKLSGLYLSLNYRLLKVLGISVSYDARKNVIYYETYKTFVDRILENDLRQGFRLSGTYRITGDLTFGLQGGYRYLKADPQPSRNIYSYFTYSSIPFLKISSTLSATLFESGFMNGTIYSLNLARDLFKGKAQAGGGFRYVSYKFPEGIRDISQKIVELNLSVQPWEKFYFAVNYEGTFEKSGRYDRLYIQLRRRF